MDQTILEVTDVPNVKVGDEVEIVSSEPAAPNSIENLAKLANTVAPEFTCGLGARVQHNRTA